MRCGVCGSPELIARLYDPALPFTLTEGEVECKFCGEVHLVHYVWESEDWMTEFSREFERIMGPDHSEAEPWLGVPSEEWAMDNPVTAARAWAKRFL